MGRKENFFEEHTRRRVSPGCFFPLTKFKTMTIKIQLSDAAYEQMLRNKTRVQGTIGLVSPTEGNFNEHRRCHGAGTHTACRAFRKLTHGRITMSEGMVHMHLAIDRAEADIDPGMVIFDDAEAARQFVEEQIFNEEEGNA